MLDEHIRRHYGKRLEDVLHNVSTLEKMLLSFFETWRVTTPSGQIEIPKKNSMDNMKSMIKGWILSQTHHVIDISSRAQFPKFCHAWKELLQRSVAKRGIEEMHSVLDDRVLNRIFGFIGHLTDLVLSRGSKDYDAMLERVPSDQHTSYHSLFQVGIHFMLNLFHIGDTRESVLKLKTSQFEKKYHSDLEMEYFDFHDSGEEKRRVSSTPVCMIPFQENKFGCNPGLTFELYLSLLNPDRDLLFQAPKRSSSKFDIHSPGTKSFYEPSPVGKNALTGRLASFCNAVEIAQLFTKSVQMTGRKHLDKFYKEKNKLNNVVMSKYEQS